MDFFHRKVPCHEDLARKATTAPSNSYSYELGSSTQNERYCDSLRARYQDLHDRFLEKLNSEKLDITWAEGRLLYAALRDTTNPHEWDDILPPHLWHNVRNAEQDQRTEFQGPTVKESSRRNILSADATKFQCKTDTMELHSTDDYATRKQKDIRERCMRSLCNDKIDCSMESLKLVQRSLTTCDASENEMDSIFEEILQRYGVSHSLLPVVMLT